MRKTTRRFAFVLSICLLLIGCGSQALAHSSSEPSSLDSQSAEGQNNGMTLVAEPVRIIRSMMGLDYPSMTVADFNKSIQTICTEAHTDIFEVIVDAYDHFGVYDDAGEFVGTVFSDRDIEHFVNSTLSYSAQEIFGEPVHLGNIAYMTLPGFTAKELYEKKEQMSFDEWNIFFEEHIAEICTWPVLSYAIKVDIATPDTLLVSERDGNINAAQASIINFFVSMDKETAMANNLWDILEVEFATISTEQSNAGMSVSCRIQGLERDMPE